MANTSIKVRSNVSTAIADLLLVDNGDGTYSLATSTPSTGSAGVIVAAGTATDRSGTITAGGTRQQLAAANSSRRYLIVQNQSSGYLYVRFTATATQDQSSMRLAPGDAWESPSGFCPTQAVDIVGATTGQAWHAVEG